MSPGLAMAPAFLGAVALPMGIDDATWLSRFHAGERQAIAECYEAHYAAVSRAAGALPAADRETVIHEVFFRLLSDEGLRRSFTGGSVGAWLHTLARNQAIDGLRRAKRDVPLEQAPETAEVDGPESSLDAKRLVDRFRREVLPEKWAGVFEKRFIEQLDQREAARQLGLSRTTLAYRELRLRAMLKNFLLRAEEP